MSAKHLQIGSIDLVLDCDNPNPNGVHPRQLKNLVRVDGNATATRIPAGMSSGKSAVMLQLDLEDGSTLLLECSLALLGSIAVVFHARDDAEGRPSSR